MSNTKMGSNTGGGTTLVGTVLSVTSGGKRHTLQDMDAMCVGRDDEVELTQISVAFPKRTNESNEDVFLSPRMPPGPTEGAPRVVNWPFDDTGHRPVSKENFI